MIVVDNLMARGHPNIVATHSTTLEITRHRTLTKKGDCIIAVEATKGLTDLSKDFRTACMNDNALILVELRTSDMVERVRGRGSHLLTLTGEEEIVIRKSSYISDRTLMIQADKAASDLRRKFIRGLKSTSTDIHVHLAASF